MPNGGKLIIDAKHKPDKKSFELSVEDTGKGIPMEIQDKLFTPLFTMKAKGHGFGLIVAERFIEALEILRFRLRKGKEKIHHSTTY
jgi:signal transduction histidine kinase